MKKTIALDIKPPFLRKVAKIRDACTV